MADMDALRRRLLRLAERTSLTFGVAGLAWWVAFPVDVGTAARDALERVAALQAGAAPAGLPDQSLWSPERVIAWLKALSEAAPPPIAVLRVAKIGLEVPVLRGTDDRTLDRAVG